MQAMLKLRKGGFARVARPNNKGQGLATLAPKQLIALPSAAKYSPVYVQRKPGGFNVYY